MRIEKITIYPNVVLKITNKQQNFSNSLLSLTNNFYSYDTVNFSGQKYKYPCANAGESAGINDTVNADEGTLLIKYAQNNNLSDLKNLLKYTNLDINKPNKYGTTALMMASANGHYDIVKELLEHEKIDINAQNKLGDTALMIACTTNKPIIVQELLKQKETQINLENNYGQTAYSLAILFGYKEVIKELLKRDDLILDAKIKQ